MKRFLEIVPDYDKVDTYTSIVKENFVQVVFAEPEEYDEISPKAAQNFYETLEESKYNSTPFQNWE